MHIISSPLVYLAYLAYCIKMQTSIQKGVHISIFLFLLEYIYIICAYRYIILNYQIQLIFIMYKSIYLYMYYIKGETYQPIHANMLNNAYLNVCIYIFRVKHIIYKYALHRKRRALSLYIYILYKQLKYNAYQMRLGPNI